MSRRQWSVLAGIIALAVFALWGPPRLAHIVATIVMDGDVNGAIQFMQRNSSWTLTVVLLLAVFQAMSVVFPLPIVVAVSVALFGPWLGFAVSWIGSILGAIAGYWTARFLGYQRLSRLINGKRLAQLEHFAAVVEDNAFYVLLVGRFVPGINLVLNYLAGLVPTRFSTFCITTALGLTPWMILFAFLSHNLLAAKTYGTWISIAIVTVFLIGLWHYGRKKQLPWNTNG